MTNFDHGRAAEAKAAEYLEQQGYRVLQRNWRTRWCEIDIVTQKDNTVYLVEVKYRQKAWQGTGLDYITPKKLQQMAFAAEFWVQAHHWPGDYSLAAVEVSGPRYEVTNFLPELM
jgi:uncharacterized protein (TIGR00252 family)